MKRSKNTEVDATNKMKVGSMLLPYFLEKESKVHRVMSVCGGRSTTFGDDLMLLLVITIEFGDHSHRKSTLPGKAKGLMILMLADKSCRVESAGKLAFFANSQTDRLIALAAAELS